MAWSKEDIRLIICDMDGTLLNSQKRVSKRNREAIAKARQRGIDFSVCTGRIQPMIEYYLQDLKIRVPVVTANGALIWDPVSRTSLWDMPVDEQEARELLAFCRRMQLDYCALTMTTSYFSPGNIRRARFEQYNRIAMEAGLRGMELKEFDQHFACLQGEKIYKILIYETEPGQLMLAQEQLDELEQTGYTSSEQQLLDIAHTTVTKGEGLRHLTEIIGIAPEQVCAMGDFDNDISLLNNAGFPVAMENGCDKVKQAAQFITRSNDEDGVAYAIETMLL